MFAQPPNRSPLQGKEKLPKAGRNLEKERRRGIPPSRDCWEPKREETRK